jgi:hypothetical protein
MGVSFIVGVTGENHLPAARRWHTFSHNIVSSISVCTNIYILLPNDNIQWNLCAICHLSFPTSCDFWQKICSPKVFLLTKIKPDYSDILHNPHIFLCQIRQVPLYRLFFLLIFLLFVNFPFDLYTRWYIFSRNKCTRYMHSFLCVIMWSYIDVTYVILTDPQ